MAFKLKEVFASELLEVAEVISSALSSKEALVENISEYLLGAGGKRVRPVLTLLMSKICGYTGKHHIFLAAAVELIHAATLLHDDVIDESSTRRSKPTANFQWGNKASILVGDFLFSQSFKLMVQSESIEALKSLSSASSVIAEGEVMQLAKLYESRMLLTEEYEEIASAKTAALFGASAHVGAIISGQSLEVQNAAKRYGQILGLMFQVKDDMLDYFADSRITGKNTADDLTQGNVTLPVIFAYNSANDNDKKNLENYFFMSDDRAANFDSVVEILRKYSVENQIELYLHNLENEAHKQINIIPESIEYKVYLTELLDYVNHRNN
jgi:octaprenyl-diphosphate synthase